MDVSKLTYMFDSRLMPQMIENPVDSIIRKIEGDTETYICNRLMELNIDKDILMNQTQEIKRLNQVIAEYERLEEQGLLLKLPCKVGDTVFTTCGTKIEIEEVIEIRLCKNDRSEFIYQYLINGGYAYFEADDIGKDVFFTYEEAEQELANRQQSHAEAIMDERNGR